MKSKIKYTHIIVFCVFLLLSSCSKQLNMSNSGQPQISNSPTNTPITKPKKFLIKTTFVPQAPEKNWDQPWQDACEEAALLTLYYYQNKTNPDLITIKNDLQKILDYETSQGWGHDVNISQIQQILVELFNINTTAINDPSFGQIEDYLYKNGPILVTANGKTLFKENKHFKNGGPLYHGLVILGFDQPKKIFTVHDVGTQFGAYFKYSYSTLFDSIHDLPQTGKNDINNGPKTILVISSK